MKGHELAAIYNYKDDLRCSPSLKVCEREDVVDEAGMAPESYEPLASAGNLLAPPTCSPTQPACVLYLFA